MDKKKSKNKNKSKNKIKSMNKSKSKNKIKSMNKSKSKNKIKSKIKIKIKNSLDMNSEEFKKYGYQLIDWVADYFENIESYPVLAQVKPCDVKSQLPKKAPSNPESFDEVINDLNKIIMPGVTHWNHPNFMAYFNSTSSGPGILGELLAAAINANGMVWKSNPSGTELEETVLNWFRDMIGLPSNYFGIVYDTASVSTMHAIAAARESTGLNVRSNGLTGLPNLILYCTEQTHSSIDKGALTLGIGLKNIRKIPTDENFAMIPKKLTEAIKEDRAKGFIPFCVVATIGTTSSTAIDPVDEIADICKKEKIWLHVDSAYAGVTAMLPEMKNYFNGIEKADSIVINPHKWLFVPVDFSILYTSKPDLLKNAFSLVPEYLKTSETDAINYMDYGIQLGRRFRSLKFWFVLRYFGVDGLQQRLREHLRLAKLFANRVDESKLFERLAPVYFGNICFRAKPNNKLNEDQLNILNEKLINKINETGKVFLVHTKLKGKFTIRLVISGLRMEERHVDFAWKLINEKLYEVLNEKSF